MYAKQGKMSVRGKQTKRLRNSPGDPWRSPGSMERLLVHAHALLAVELGWSCTVNRTPMISSIER